jgi:hypothetical protein
VAEPAIVDVAFEERYWYPDDGGVVWVAGFHVVDAEGRFVGRDAPLLAERGLVVTHAAGAAQHHGAGLASDGAAPGRPLTLRRDPANAFDPNAIAVDTADGEQVGWVPREMAASIAPALDAGEPWSAVVLREQRASPREPRTGVTMLLARAASVELHELRR